MDLTIEQWERLQMMVSNPSREGIKTITITLDDDNKEWEINSYPTEAVLFEVEDDR